MIKPLPDYKTLIDYFYVIDGMLYWKNIKTNRSKNGGLAGGVCGLGYMQCFFQGKSYKVHRLIWKMYHGLDPVGNIDHIDGNPLNNNIDNLRVVGQLENGRNTKFYKNNTSGTMGIYQHKGSSKWFSSIKVNGKSEYLGTFTEKSEAINARKEAEIKYGFHKNHGRKL